MSLLFETIQCKNGKLLNLDYHDERMNRSRLELFRSPDALLLDEYIKGTRIPLSGLYKCRVVYEHKFFSIEYVPYKKKPIHSMKIIELDDISYKYKFMDRSQLNDLLASAGTDEILIIRDGVVTDTSFSNIIFFNGYDWVTPIEPLLKGTQRQKLLDEGKIIESEILTHEIFGFQSMKLINAMMTFEESPELPLTLLH